MDISKLIDIVQAIYYYIPRMTRDQVQEVLQSLIALMEIYFQNHSIDLPLLQKLEDVVNRQKHTGIRGILE